jgi:tetratricopeptide (TPR) repeat protein
MSGPIAKGVRRLSSRSASRHSSASTSTRKRTSAGKATRLKPATKRSPAGKARAQKATKVRAAKPKSRPTPVRKKTARPASKARTSKPSRKIPVKASRVKVSKAVRRPAPPPRKPTPPPQLTYDEAAALAAFEAAHKDFGRGRFAEARNQFRALVERFPTVSEVTARARTYLAVTEARLRSELAPRDDDSLYDRGVIELNRGEYVAAQELFERALRRDPEASHIHYGLAASRARLGAIDTAIKSLRRALDLQPSLRIRAQRDHDLNSLRSDPEFDQLIFSNPPVA